jgi:CBS domain-containing protein
MLSALLVRDAMAAPGPVLFAATPVSAAGEGAREAGAVVVNASAEAVGVITQSRIEEVLRSDDPAVLTEAAMSPLPDKLGPDDTLEAALGRLVDAGMSSLPVLDGGRVTVRDILQTYKATLRRSVRRAATLPHDTSLFEARIAASSPLVGRTLSEARLTRDALVVSITRDGETLFPRASTRIEAGDVLMVTTQRANEAPVRAFLEGSPPAPS